MVAGCTAIPEQRLYFSIWKRRQRPEMCPSQRRDIGSGTHSTGGRALPQEQPVTWEKTDRNPGVPYLCGGPRGKCEFRRCANDRALDQLLEKRRVRNPARRGERRESLLKIL